LLKPEGIVVDYGVGLINGNLGFLISNLSFNGKSGSTCLCNLGSQSVNFFSKLKFALDELGVSGLIGSNLSGPFINLGLISRGLSGFSGNFGLELHFGFSKSNDVFTHVHLVLDGDHELDIGSLSNQYGLGDSQHVSSISDLISIVSHTSLVIRIFFLSLLDLCLDTVDGGPSIVNQGLDCLGFSLINKCVESLVEVVEGRVSGVDSSEDSVLYLYQAIDNLVGSFLGVSDLYSLFGECLGVLVGFVQSGGLQSGGGLLTVELCDLCGQFSDLNLSCVLLFLSFATHDLALVIFQRCLKFGC